MVTVKTSPEWLLMIFSQIATWAFTSFSHSGAAGLGTCVTVAGSAMALSRLSGGTVADKATKGFWKLP